MFVCSYEHHKDKLNKINEKQNEIIQAWSWKVQQHKGKLN